MAEENNISIDYIDRIEFADGSVINGSAGYDGDRTVWAWVNAKAQMPFMEAVQLFNNPEKTSQIKTYLKDTLINKWEGYTEIYTITRKGDGRIDVALRKPNT